MSSFDVGKTVSQTRAVKLIYTNAPFGKIHWPGGLQATKQSRFNRAKKLWCLIENNNTARSIEITDKGGEVSNNACHPQEQFCDNKLQSNQKCISS